MKTSIFYTAILLASGFSEGACLKNTDRSAGCGARYITKAGLEGEPLDGEISARLVRGVQLILKLLSGEPLSGEPLVGEGTAQETATALLAAIRTKEADEKGLAILHSLYKGGRARGAILRNINRGGANFNIQGESGVTALHAVMLWEGYEKEEQFRYEAANALLAHGADPDIQDNKGKAALHYWILRPFKPARTARLLLANGADPNIPDNNGGTVLHELMKEGGGEGRTVFLVQEAGVNPNIPNKNGETALIMAAQDELLEDVKILAAIGADTNIQDNKGKTALHAVMQWNRRRGRQQYEAALALLENGADPNIPDNNGETALHAAGRRLQTDLAELLLAHGADPDIENNDGATVFDLQQPILSSRQNDGAVRL